MYSIRFIFIIFSILSLYACVSPIPLEKQIAQVNYQVSSPILIAVIDKRKRLSTPEEIKKAQEYVYGGDEDDESDSSYDVSAIRTEKFVGVAHGVYGIPSDLEIENIAPKKEDKDKTLAQFLADRIVKGLKKNNWNVQSIQLKTTDANKVRQTLNQHNATQLIILVLNEWYFSINLNWVSAFNFDTDVTIFSYSKNRDSVFSKQIKERDVIDEKATDSFQNFILSAYKAQLDQIFNDIELKEALLN